MKILLMSFLVYSSVALSAGHDFSREVWSEGKTCLLCHSLKDYLPRVLPPGSKMIDITKLEPQVQEAFNVNTNNLMCIACHQDKHSVIAPRKSQTSLGSTLPSPTNPGTGTSGSEGSINIRIINSGNNTNECLRCHDLHNANSEKMLKEDYWQN
jgi:hypothetical protein